MKSFSTLLLIILCILPMYAIDNCLQFDGQNEHLNTDYNSNLDQWTIECWINADNAPATGETSTIINRGSNFAMIWNHSDSQTQGSISVTIDGTPYNASFGTLAASKWYHLAGTYDGETLKAYRDGVLLGTNESPSGNPDASAESLKIGAFDGLVDEVRVWNVARTGDKLRQEMYRQLSSPVGETNLELYYTFNETTGSTIYDSKSNVAATLVDMDASNRLASSAMYGPKQTLFMGGNTTTTYANCGPIFNPSIQQVFTIECWARPIDFSAYRRLITLDYVDTDASGCGMLALNRTSGAIYTYLTGSYQEFQTRITANRWNHLALVCDGSTIKLYVNGALDPVELPVTSLANSDNDMLLGWGGRYNNTRLYGYLDEVRVWGTARTSSEVGENMCRNLTGNEAGLMAYYNFDNNDGDVLQDFSGNGHDGAVIASSSIQWANSSAFTTWLDGSSSSWPTAANWSAGVPGTTSNVGIYDCDNEPNFNFSFTVNDLYIGSGVGSILNVDITVNGGLILDTDWNLNGRTITLGSGGSLVENGGTLTGSNSEFTTTRSLSNIDEDVAGLGAIITTASDMGLTTIIRTHEPTQQNGINRMYRISPTNNSGLNATLVFNYLDSELNGLNEAALALFRSTDGENWVEQESAVLNTANNTLTLAGIDQFSYWTAGESGTTLPVHFSSFTAEELASHFVSLEWTTQSETDMLGYNVLRSESDQESQALTINTNLIAASNLTTETTYEFVDEDVLENRTYWYWIENIEAGGYTQLYGPVNVTLGEDIHEENPPDAQWCTAIESNYPNPFNPSTTIVYTLEKESSIEVDIFNHRGQRVRSFSDHKPKGRHNVNWDGKDSHGKSCGTGIYYFRMQANGKTDIIKGTLLK